MSSLVITATNVAQADGSLKFVFDGQIDETSDYSAVQVREGAHLAFDMEGITLINSTGIQNWIKFLDALPEGVTITLINCPVRIINQVNIFPDFFGNRSVDIRSLHLPYFCETCDESVSILSPVTALETSDAAPRAPEATCATCKNTMEFDAVEKKFFQFLGRGKIRAA